MNQKNKKLIGECIYRHPSMDLSELNNPFLPILFQKCSYESKTIVFLEYFNASLLNYDIDTEIFNFLDIIPHTTSPTHITARSKFLIDNIFSNAYDSTFKSGNLLTLSLTIMLSFFFSKVKLKQTKPQKGNTIEISCNAKTKKLN